MGYLKIKVIMLFLPIVLVSGCSVWFLHPIEPKELVAECDD